MIVDAIGAGLIAGGALVLFWSLRLPGPGIGIELHRRKRNTSTATAIGALATLAGSVLLLLSTDWILAVPSAAGVGVACWLTLVWRTHWVYREGRRQMLETRRLTGTIMAGYGTMVGLFDPSVAGDSKAFELPMQGESAEETIARFDLRATWWWACCHPLGARNEGL